MKNDQSSKQPASGEIVDLASFRKQKETSEELGRGRKPLYVSHRTGKLSDTPSFKRPSSPDFGDRLQRIRSSLDKINSLMNELKKMSTQSERELETKQSSSSQSK